MGMRLTIEDSKRNTLLNGVAWEMSIFELTSLSDCVSEI